MGDGERRGMGGREDKCEEMLGAAGGGREAGGTRMLGELRAPGRVWREEDAGKGRQGGWARTERGMGEGGLVETQGKKQPRGDRDRSDPEGRGEK